MANSPEVIALDRTKIALMRIPDTIFYSSILFSLKQSWTHRIKTAATDGVNLFINPDFFLSLTELERIGLLIHEVLHVAYSHMTRIGKRHPKVWNCAGDHVINLSIMLTGKYQLPAGGLCDPQFHNMSTEEVYEVILDEAEKKGNGGAGADGIIIPGGEDIEYPKDSQELDELEREIASIVTKASIQAKAANPMHDHIPGEIKLQVEKITNPQLPWNVILQNYFTDFAKEDYSWRRPNRRYLPNFYLPSAYSEAVTDLAIAVDASGSVSSKEFSFFIAEIASIQEMLKPEKITLIAFDTEISNIQTITSSTNILSEVKFTGGGGTEIDEVLAWADKTIPTVLLVFTDGYFDMPPNLKPDYPIVWLINDNNDFTTEHGEVIHFNIDK